MCGSTTTTETFAPYYADVTTSPLYKTIAKSLSSKDKKEFARMLTLARDNYDDEDAGWPMDLSKPLGVAFSWASTPQGFEYWDELYERLEAAGVEGAK